jgi:hypothetical protein
MGSGNTFAFHVERVLETLHQLADISGRLAHRSGSCYSRQGSVGDEYSRGVIHVEMMEGLGESWQFSKTVMCAGKHVLALSAIWNMDQSVFVVLVVWSTTVTEHT